MASWHELNLSSVHGMVEVRVGSRDSISCKSSNSLTKADDTCVVAAWSEADIVTPKATAKKDWYVYLPDDPRCISKEILEDPCQECLEEDCTDCVFRKPLIL